MITRAPYERPSTERCSFMPPTTVAAGDASAGGEHGECFMDLDRELTRGAEDHGLYTCALRVFAAGLEYRGLKNQ